MTRHRERADKELDRLIKGEKTWEDTTEAVQSWARLYIHQEALKIAQERRKEIRAQMARRIPEMHHSRIKAEVVRLWRLWRWLD